MENPVRRKCYRRHSSKPNVLVPYEDTIESIESGDVLLKVHAIALNYRDINILNGTNHWPVLSSGIPCSDAAGEVVAIGSKVTRFKIGDRVSPIVDQKSITGREQEREWLGGEVDGILASSLVMNEERLVEIPTHLSWAEAACLPCAGVTAWSGLAVAGVLVNGKTILIQGTGGVSLMAAKLAQAAGCKNIITSSSDEKLFRVRKIEGLAEFTPLNYKTTPKWHEEAIRANGTLGVDIVIENGGTSSLLQSCAAVAKRGIISQIGYLGQQDPNDLQGLVPALIEKVITLRGINVGSRQDFEDMIRFIELHKMSFKSLIDRVFPFEMAMEAFAYLKTQEHIGKVVVQIE